MRGYHSYRTVTVKRRAGVQVVALQSSGLHRKSRDTLVGPQERSQRKSDQAARTLHIRYPVANGNKLMRLLCTLITATDYW